jgi:UDP-N-acetylmuramyl tripeptide synthase
VARPDFAAAAKGEEVKKNTMRKLFALVMAGLLTLALALAVVGCGGDRDRTKRPLMGREAEEHADVVVVTSDNPRSEDPAAIIAEIVGGLRRPHKATVQADRRVAIFEAVAEARTGDVVMILGKGHESGQEFSTGTIPFDDRQVAREALLSRGAKT